MEFQFSFILFLFTFLFFLFFFTKVVVVSNSRLGPKRVPKLPPGPWKLPLIGNLHQMIGSLPHHTLQKLAQKHGPIMHLKLGEVSTIVISSAEAAKETLKTHDLIFSSRAEISAAKVNVSILFAPYGDYWKEMRKIVTVALFTSKRLLSFRSIREEEVQNLIEGISFLSSSGLHVDLSEKVFKLTNDITARVLFGKKCKHADVFIKEINEGIKLGSGFDFPDTFPSLKFLHPLSGLKAALEKNHFKMNKILEDIVSEHKLNSVEGSNKDLVHVLLETLDHGNLQVPFAIEHVMAILMEIFAAGSDSSSTVIEWAMSEMLRNPRVMEKAQAEVRQVFELKGKLEEEDIQDLTYLKLVIKETLRLHPSAPLLIPREARENCVLNGYEVAMKTKVIINAWAIGRDPKYWVRPECFEPERFSKSAVDFRGANFEFIPFGAGRRICPGISFGIMTVELTLACLLCHFDWKLPLSANGIKAKDLDMTERFGVVAKRKNPLYVTATPYPRIV